MGKDRVKAVVMVEPGKVEVQEFPYPQIEKDAMVIKIEMAGIWGTDKNTLKVGDRVTVCPNIICKKCWYCRHVFGWPYCANNKTYGVYFRSDQPPHITGGWAEYMYIFPGSWVYKVPEDMPPEVAVNIELMVVTNNVDRAKGYMEFASRGFGLMDTVLIQGVGAMGLAHLIKARVH